MRVLMMVMLACFVHSSAAGDDDHPYRADAAQIVHWLEHVAVDAPGGIAWPADPEATDEPDFTLYSGTPGVVLFLLEYARVTGDDAALALAKRSAAALAHHVMTPPDDESMGLWTGLAGNIHVLLHAWDQTGDDSCRAAAIAGLQRLIDRAEEAEHGVRWNDSTDIISGSAGIGRFLLSVRAHLHDEPIARTAHALALRAGEDLLARADEVDLGEGRVGFDWAMTPTFPRRMPNFSHGTAGVSYFLYSLGRSRLDMPGDERFIDAAQRGADYLLHIATQAREGMEICHHIPGGEELFYLGWCHGPVGTTRLFHLLDRDQPDDRYRAPYNAGIQAIINARIPDERTPGFWNNVGQCCGTAGVIAFMIDVHQTFERSDTPRDDCLGYAVLMADHLRRHATLMDLPDGRTGRAWRQAEHRVRPELLQMQTGYMQGAAGVGLCLLQLDAALRDDGTYDICLPDSPYPSWTGVGRIRYGSDDGNGH